MQQCRKCKLFGNAASFYTNNTLCKLCINSIRRDRIQPAVLEAQKAMREQTVILNVIKNLQTNKEPLIYLIEASGRYKIGFSTNLETRIRAFNTANSVPCKIVAVVPGDRRLEQELHRKFKFHRINKEWFSNSITILKTFQKLSNVIIFLQGHMTQEGSGPSCSMDAPCE